MFSAKFLPVLAFLLACMFGVGCCGFLLGGNIATLRELDAEESRAQTFTEENPTDISFAPPEENTAPVSLAAQAVIVNCGDAMFEYPLLEASYDSSTGLYDFSYCFTYIRDLLSYGDLTAANLESVLDGTMAPVQAYNAYGYERLLAPDAVLDACKQGGITMLTTANNHANDAGLAGMQRTVRKLDNAGFLHTGTRADGTELPYVITEVNGIQFGILAYTYCSQRGADEPQALNGNNIDLGKEDLYNKFYEAEPGEAFYEEIGTRIRMCREAGAEAIICYVHWGMEFTDEETQRQRNIAQGLTDAGADLIVGAHTHCVQPMDVYTAAETGKKVPCFYSLGSVISPMNETDSYAKCADGVIAAVTFSRSETGVVSITNVTATPTWIHHYWANGREMYRTLPLYENTDYMTAYSLGADNDAPYNAKNAYNRIMDIIGDGYAEIQNEFTVY